LEIGGAARGELAREQVAFAVRLDGAVDLEDVHGESGTRAEGGERAVILILMVESVMRKFGDV
jgi:hypothetical protein